MCSLECICFQRALMQTNLRMFAPKNASLEYVSTQLMIGKCSPRISLRHSSSTSNNILVESQISLADSVSNHAKSTDGISDKEIQRRKKIGLGNKARTPWNKGRKHNEETRTLIKKRTIEALSDPKVRKKMSEWPHSHSNQSKERISIALKKIWEERLKFKRSQEKCYSMWASSIAEAARQGGHDQDELSWNSYGKIKAEIESHFLQQKAEKARAKEIAKLRAERMAKIRAEKPAQQWKQKEENAKAKEVIVSTKKKHVNKKNMMVMTKAMKLKARLTKFHHRRKQLDDSTSIRTERSIGPQMVMEQWDMELIKTEKMRRRVSLADQIQTVKNGKARFDPNEEVITTLDSYLGVELEDSLYCYIVQ